MKKIIIKKEIFKTYPSFKRGIILVKNIDITNSNNNIKKLLDSEIENKKNKDLENHPNILAWNKVHTQFGSNPKRFPPSMYSLIKRIQKDGFPFINSAVASFNYISLKYLIPCGGDDIDNIQGNLVLGLATGNEIFIALGSEENDPPKKDEIIYYDDYSNNVMCRRWNWRNGDFSKITSKTKHLVINLDGIDTTSKEEILLARDELANVLKTHCKAEIDVDFLDKDHFEIELPF